MQIRMVWGVALTGTPPSAGRPLLPESRLFTGMPGGGWLEVQKFTLHDLMSATRRQARHLYNQADDEQRKARASSVTRQLLVRITLTRARQTPNKEKPAKPYAVRVSRYSLYSASNSSYRQPS